MAQKKTAQQTVDGVAGRAVTLRKQVHDQLTSANVLKQIERMAPQGSPTGEQFVRVVLSEIGRNEVLLQCSPRSIIRACYEAASLGLMINGVLGHAYLVPYLGKTKAAQLIIGYRGLVELAMRSGKLRQVGAELVHANDSLTFAKG